MQGKLSCCGSGSQSKFATLSGLKCDSKQGSCTLGVNLLVDPHKKGKQEGKSAGGMGAVGTTAGAACSANGGIGLAGGGG